MMPSLGSSKHPTVCQAIRDDQYNLASTSRDSWWERQGDSVKERQGFLKEIEDKENPQDCLGGRDGTISNMVSPEILEERVSKLRPSGQAEIAWVFKAWETRQVWGI